MAGENRDWGYDRIAGALANLGYEISDQTVGNVLRRHGLPPAPERKRTTTWATFIRTHLALLAGTDFFPAEVLTLRGLVTYYVLFFIHLESRRVDIAGITVHPNEAWMKQIARNATMDDWGVLRDCRYLLHDRDTEFTRSFRAIITSGWVKPLALPARSPNLNAYAERWVRSVKEECLSKVILFGERSLRRALSDYVDHFHAERNHQGKGNVLLFPQAKGSAPRGGSEVSGAIGRAPALLPSKGGVMTRPTVQFFDPTGLWSASEGGASTKSAEVNLLPRDFVERVILYKDKVEIVMSEEGLKKLAPHDSPAILATRPRSQQPKKFSVAVRLARRGRSGRLESSDGKVDDRVGRPDAAVVKAISRAHDWLGRFERGEVASYHELARAEGFTPGYVRSVMQLAFLAPPLVEAFLDGRRQLRGGVVELLNDSLSLSWQQQHASL